jgi:pentose-5-phosphate-3-epimerase
MISSRIYDQPQASAVMEDGSAVPIEEDFGAQELSREDLEVVRDLSQEGDESERDYIDVDGEVEAATDNSMNDSN